MGKRTTSARVCKYIQMYVRLLETDENGYGYCCSCGKMLTWAETQGGHFQPKGRNYNAASVEEENVHVQCCNCNCNLGGNPAGYSKYMMLKYDKDVIEHLESLSHKVLDVEEWQELGKIYKQKCKDLIKTKNFPIKMPS